MWQKMILWIMAGLFGLGIGVAFADDPIGPTAVDELVVTDPKVNAEVVAPASEDSQLAFMRVQAAAMNNYSVATRSIVKPNGDGSIGGPPDFGEGDVTLGNSGGQSWGDTGHMTPWHPSRPIAPPVTEPPLIIPDF